MARRKDEKVSPIESMIKIWEYLRKNTDEEHPITQAEMKKEESMKGYIRNKQTFHRLIINMALAMNSDEDGIMNPEEKWKILFDDLIKFYENEDEEQESIWDTMLHLKGLYYRRTFSYQEINALIEGVLASKTLDTKAANALIDKIEENLTTKFYKKGPKHICKVREPQLADRNSLQDNLRMIQKAIDENVQIAFRFNGYTYRKRLEAKSEKKHQVSPYYIVASGGRYYLLACKPIVKNGNTIQNMSIWRIDLMTELEIPERNEALGIGGESRIPKRNVENLPLEWEDDFLLKHLHMSFDKPETITLRVKCEKEENNPKKRVRPDYTFLHDWFGDTFRYKYSESEPPYDDIVEVECSPYGMVNWALQYSDRVEVLKPETVRKEVIRKIKALNEKYQM